MGMSASQARFLSLTARKNNVEFHGQQINQQRTTLSNESANYYSELCNLSVPIPPSIDDYTKITYTFDDGAVKNTLISLYPDRKGGARNKYIVNYTESWKDDYAIVPVHSSMVETDNPSNPTRYSIGNQVLRVAGQAPAAANEDVYYSSLSEEQRTALLENEKVLLQMAQEKTADSGNFFIRYVQNTTSGNYEPYLYAESELKQGNKYNDKNLGSIPCYTLGEDTQTREVLNKSAIIEQDPSGRYVAITIDLGTATRDIYKDNSADISAYYGNTPAPRKEDYTIDNSQHIPHNNQNEIDGYYATHPEPQQKDYQTEVTTATVVTNEEEVRDYINEHPEPDISDYTTEIHDTTLSSRFNYATKGNQYYDGCYDHVMDPNYHDREGCYKHVLAHMIDLEYDWDYDETYEPHERYGAKAGAYPKSGIETTVPGYSITIQRDDVTISNISIHWHTEDMQMISDALTNGYTPEGSETNFTLMAGDISTYNSLGLSQDALNLLGDYYIKDGGGTLIQKLMSNYMLDENGEVVKKTLKQKAIDLFYICDNLTDIGGDLDNYLIPAVKAFQEDMKDFTAVDTESYERDHDDWVIHTTINSWTETTTSYVDDVERYTIEHQKWVDGIPEYKEWEEIIPGSIFKEDEYNEAVRIYREGAPKYNSWTEQEEIYLGTRRYKLTATTTTDEDAYNNAMNQYYYNQQQYEHKIQEINSKIEIIQQQDKNLELKLKQLDTEENAISTEIDAVKKVISKNVESSFKTFNA